jgi:hypothetical protein
MWSDGPEIEDRVGQVVKYSTSPDGMKWNAPRLMTPYPPQSGPDSSHYNTRNKEGFRYISRVFLGIQIQCAQCHDHFTEPWKRVQFHELAAYFSRIKYQQLFDNKKLVGVQLVTVPDREHKMTSLEDPESFSVMHPRFLDGRSPDRNLSDRERRQALADVVVDKQSQAAALK